ncbi:MAG: pilus assembly protein TadG-related protein [Vicinamibacterales bacterium]
MSDRRLAHRHHDPVARAGRPRRQRERGAVLVHVSAGLVAIMAFSALVVDYGVMWVARRQAQNAADAGALSAGVSLSFVNPDDRTLATNSALQTARLNRVWDAAPDVTAADVTYPTCPAGAPGVAGTCVQVDVFRNQRGGGNPLPTFFGQLVGLTRQGVRATATAQLLVGDTSDCVKPFAIPDKWQELRPVPKTWQTTDTFERYVQNGRNRGQVLVPADVYTPPTTGSPGTGFSLPTDYGLQLILKQGNPGDALAPGQFQPVVINPVEGPGGSNYRDNIATCDPTPIGPGTVLQSEPGNMIGPTRQGVADLIALDPSAHWNPSANGGRGAPAGGCQSTGACSRSPRLVAVPVFSPDVFDLGRSSGRIDITVVNVVGVWLEGLQGNDVIGYLTHYPSLTPGTTTVGASSSFVRTVILVR